MFGILGMLSKFTKFDRFDIFTERNTSLLLNLTYRLESMKSKLGSVKRHLIIYHQALRLPANMNDLGM